MKRIFSLAALLCVFAVAAFSQAKPTDFSGTWVMDVSKSQLGERSRIEGMTMTVVQSDKELKVTTETKRAEPPADATQVGPGGRRMGRGFGGGDGTIAFSLDGKETIVEIEGPNGKVPVKYKGAIEGGKVNLSSSRTFAGPMGEVSMTTKDVWSLSADGKTLTAVKEQSSPRGTNSSTMVFVKK